MKILFILEYYFPHIGGVETCFQKLAEGCANKGHSVRVITTHLKGSPFSEKINGVEIIRLKMPYQGQRYWFTFLGFFQMIGLAKRFDLIHTTTYNAALPAWLVSLLLRKKIVITVHEVWGKLWHSLSGMNRISAMLHRWFETFILKLPYDSVVAVSRYTYNSLRNLKIPDRKLKMIYHGIDYDFFNPDKYDTREVIKTLGIKNKFVYTYFGRPGWAKGLDFLIKAVPEIKKNIPNSLLLLILSKDPPNRYLAIQKLIKQLSLVDGVRIIDSVPHSELPKYLKASNCIVVPSLSEGFGFIAAESTAMKIPLVVSEAGSLPEVVSGKVCFCQARDSHSIASAVIRSHDKKYEFIPEKKFYWPDMIDKYLKLYNSLADKQ